MSECKFPPYIISEYNKLTTETQGQCQGSSFGKEISLWVQQHKAIVIGVCVAVGVIILLLIIRCLFSCIRRRRYPSKRARPPTNAAYWPGAADIQPPVYSTQGYNNGRSAYPAGLPMRPSNARYKWGTGSNGSSGESEVSWRPGPGQPPPQTWRYM
jgi:hypothetical protein